ncbi:MAG: hypothetical protein R2880_18295 [Deinococcales bacterium]
MALKDSAGRLHPVMADVGCRNTVFGAEAQASVKHLSDWLKAGLYHYRLEFVHESAQQVTQIVKAFQDFLQAKLDPICFESLLKAKAQRNQ